MNPGKARSVIGKMMVFREVKLELEPANRRWKDEWDVLAHMLELLNAASPPDPRRAQLTSAELSFEREKLRGILRPTQAQPREPRCTCERCPVHSKKAAAE